MITGYNTDVRHNDVVFHVQTEDKGASNPFIESLVYVGGQVLASKRASYAELLAQGKDDKAIVALMDHQHRTMIAAIRLGKFDEKLQVLTAGRQTGRHATGPQVAPPAPLAPMPPAASAASAPVPPPPAPPVAASIDPQATMGPRPPAPPPPPPRPAAPMPMPAMSAIPAIPAMPAMPAIPAIPAISAPVAPAPIPRVAPPPPPPAAAPRPQGSVLAASKMSERSLDQVILEYLTSEADQEQLLLMLEGEPQLALGRPAAVALRASSSKSGQPIPGAQVSVKMISTVAEPRMLANGRTDDQGGLSLTFEIPPLTRGTAALIITATSAIGRAELKQLL